MRKTKIVATVGPACSKLNVLKTLIREGVDVFRINASHTTPQTLKQWILLVRKSAKASKKHVGLMVDLQGPRVRTGRLKNGSPLILKASELITIEVSAQPGSGHLITTTCEPFCDMVKSGDRILMDNGSMELKVLAVEKSRVRCQVLVGGTLGENKGINLPNAPTTLPALTQKDLEDLEVAAQLEVDYVALSFVRSEEDVRAIKNWMESRGKDIPVIAKIEKPGAVNHIEAILETTDGLMVARGDLGIELGVQKVPLIQKRLIERANQSNVPVITATQMLETMMEKPLPTRAEVSDIANAVFDGTDAVMLSGETAIGKYPVEAVRMMSEIIVEAEKNTKSASLQQMEASFHHGMTPLHAITHAARNAAHHLNAKAIVVFTLSGKTALLVSKLKPNSLVITLTVSEKVASRLALLHGIVPLLMKHSKSTDQMIYQANQVILKSGLLEEGDPVVLVSGKQALPGARYMTKIHHIGER